MNDVLKKTSCLVVVALIFFVNTVYTMDTPGKQKQPGRQLLLNSIKARMRVCLEKKPFKRSCDEFYGDVSRDRHCYIEFNPNGRYLIEAREKNVARLTVTDMKTQKSSCIPVGNYERTVVTCNKDHALVGGSVFRGKHHLLKISLAHGTLLKNFSDKVMPLQQGCYGYDQIVYNPCKSSFIFVLAGESDRFFCLYDSRTGGIKNYWKENSALGGDSDISYSPDGIYCLILGKKNINMIDPETGEKQWTIPEIAQSVTWHPQSSCFIINARSKHAAVRAKTGEIICTFDDPLQRVKPTPHYYHDPKFRYESGWTEQSFFTAGGNYFISLFRYSSKTIFIRNGKTYEIIDSIRGDIDYDTVSESSDGRYLAYSITSSYGFSDIVIYDFRQCKEVARKSLKKLIRALRWRPNKHQFITTEYDSTKLMLWDVKFDHVCKEAFDGLETADDWCVGFIADMLNGAAHINDIDQETYATLPESVQTLLNCVKQNK